MLSVSSFLCLRLSRYILPCQKYLVNLKKILFLILKVLYLMQQVKHLNVFIYYIKHKSSSVTLTFL